MEIVILDVWPFPAGEAFGEGYQELTAVETVGLVLDARQLIDTLDHVFERQYFARCVTTRTSRRSRLERSAVTIQESEVI